LAGRLRVVPPTTVDVRAIREKLHLSQSAFAARFGFTAASVRQWEQGRRQPQGPARVLLTIIDREPVAVQRALHAGGWAMEKGT
jgi:putative transcriptional regulator